MPHWALPKQSPFLYSLLGKRPLSQEPWDGCPFSSSATTCTIPVDSFYWTSVESVSSPPCISKNPLGSPCPTWNISETSQLVFCLQSYLHLQYSFHIAQSEVSNNQSNHETEQSWRHHTSWLQTILRSYSDLTVWYWHENRHIDQ